MTSSHLGVDFDTAITGDEMFGYLVSIPDGDARIDDRIVLHVGH